MFHHLPLQIFCEYSVSFSADEGRSGKLQELRGGGGGGVGGCGCIVHLIESRLVKKPFCYPWRLPTKIKYAQKPKRM